MFFCLMGMYGIAYGAQIANLLAAVYDFCGADKMVILFGLELLLEGVGGLLGGPACSEYTNTVATRASLLRNIYLFIYFMLYLLHPLLHLAILFNGSRKSEAC